MKSMRTKIKEELYRETCCNIQHNGWSCNSCFHCLDLKLKKDIHEYWLAVLALRGDYPDLPKRPDLIEELYKALRGWKRR